MQKSFLQKSGNGYNHTVMYTITYLCFGSVMDVRVLIPSSIASLIFVPDKIATRYYYIQYGIIVRIPCMYIAI